MRIKIRIFVYIIMFFGLYQYTFKKFIPIPFFDIIISQCDDILLLMGLSLILVTFLSHKKWFILVKTPLDKFLLIIFIYMFISFLLNGSSIFNFFLTIKNYFFVFILYYIIMYSRKFTMNDIYKITKFLLSLLSIQVILQGIEFIIVYKQGSLNDDSLMGSFSGANNLGYTLFIPIFLLLYLHIIKIHTYTKYLYILLLSLIATFAEFAFLSVPFFFFLYNFKQIISIKRLINISKFVLIFIGIFVSISVINPQRTSGTNSIFKIFSPEFLIYKITQSEFDVYSGSARMLWFPITWDRLNDKTMAFNQFIGMGPGMYASYAAFKTMPYTNESIFNIFGQLEKGLDPNVDSQFIPIWGEFGHIGLILFLIFYFYLSRYYYLNYKRSKNTMVKALNITASASSLYLILGMYVNHILETQTIMIVYIVIIALAQKSYTLERKIIEKTNININTIN